MRALVVRFLLLLTVTSARCGVVIILEDGSWEDNVIPKLHNGHHNTRKFEDESWIDNNMIPRFDDSYYNLREVEDIPDPKDVALMARYVVHSANWTSVAYTSHQKGTEGRPLASMFSVSDGPVQKGSGIPYFYVSRLQAAVTDLMDNDKRCSLMMSLAESNVCKDKGWDPEDPRCAHVVMTGTFHKMNNESSEYPVAAKAVFTRHPDFMHLPDSHHFFLAKFNIDTITIQDTFGGPAEVPIWDYLNVDDARFKLAAVYPKISPLVDLA